MTHEFMNHPTDEESLLQAYANQEDITFEIVQLLRIVMRGVASQETRAAAYQTQKQFLRIFKLIRRSEQFNEHEAFNDAFTKVKSWGRSEPRQEHLIEAALHGMRYLIEITADDNFARGRASQREWYFLRSIERLV